MFVGHQNDDAGPEKNYGANMSTRTRLIEGGGSGPSYAAKPG